jgi:hypothetical protein
MSAPIYFLDAAPSGTAFAALQIGSTNGFVTGAPANATFVSTGWSIPTTAATDIYSSLLWNTVQATGTFSSTVGPPAGVGTNRSFQTQMPISASYAAANWSINIPVIMNSAATSGTAALVLRFYKGTTAGGAVELPNSPLTMSAISLTTTGQQNTTATWAPGEVTFNGEFFWVEMALKVVSGSTNSGGITCSLRTDAAHGVITPPNSISAKKLFVLGYYGPAIASPPAGADHEVEQVMGITSAGATVSWQPIYPVGSLSLAAAYSTFASSAFDPTINKAFLAGNGDENTAGANQHMLRYDPAINEYQSSTAVVPTGCGGAGAGACVKGISYFIGGFNPSSNGSTIVFSWTNSQAVVAGTFSTSGSFGAYGALATGVGGNVAVAIGTKIYHGSGDTADAAGTPVATWYSWDPTATANPVATVLTSMPVAVAAASAVVAPNGLILLVGGYQTGDTNGRGHVLVQAYNPTGASITVGSTTIAAGAWAKSVISGGTFTNFPIDVANAASCVFQGKIWVAGGTTSAGFGTFTSNVYVSSDNGNSWTLQGQTLSTPGVASIMFAAPTSLGSNPVFWGTNS